jgi:hypothetical protein
MSTTTTDPTAPCPATPLRQPPIPPGPKPAPETAAARPTNGYATTASTSPARSPCATKGRLCFIGIGRAHVLVLIQGPHIGIFNAATGDLLRKLELDPTQRYQPTQAANRPTPKTIKP